MANYNQKARRLIADLGMGLRVDRASAILPQTTSDDLFTVYVGMVQLQIVGEVTDDIQDQANNTNLEFLPTATAGARNDLCAVLNIADDAAGTLYYIDGTAGNALQDTGTNAWLLPQTPLVMAPGTIELHCAASNTGKVAWTIWYVPLEPGAYVAAV